MPSEETVGNYWQERQKELEQHLNTGNFNEFLTWWEVGITMYVGHFPFIDAEFAALRNKRPHWIELIQEPGIGGAVYYPGTNTSPNLIHQAHHLMVWEETTGRKVSELSTISEFGGGYGAMRLVAHRLGFRGDYYIQDLPVYGQLQRKYLTHVAPEALVKTSWGSYQTLPDLFIGMWSISESPEPTRGAYLGSDNRPESWLIGYQEHFEGIFNPAWFDLWTMHRKGTYDFTTIPLALENNWYLIGVKK